MFSALRSYNFKLFWYGQAVSLPGSWMQTIAIAWLVLKLTGRKDTLGFVTMLQFLPILLLAPVGGVFADRVSKRKFLLCTQTMALLQAMAIGLLVWSRTIQLWELYVLSLIGGLNAAFDNPTRQAFVVEMVAREDLSNAVALNSGLFNAARIVGPAIGGELIASSAGLVGAFLANAASYVAAIIALLLMRPGELRPGRKPVVEGVFTQIMQGWRYCLSQPSTILIVVMMAVLGTFGYNFTVVLPLIARFVLHSGSKGLGYLNSAMGLGSLVGAIILARRKDTSYTILIAGAIVFALFLLLVSLTVNPWLTYALLFFTGCASLLCNATGNTLLQISTPDELRGRVMSIYFLLLAGSTPIGGELTGLCAQHFQIRPTLGVEACICVLGGIWCLIYFRYRRVPNLAVPSPAHPTVNLPRAGSEAARESVVDGAAKDSLGVEAVHRSNSPPCASDNLEA